MVYAQQESVLERKKYQIFRDFEVQKDRQTQASIPDLILINKKKRNCRLVDFVIQVDHRVKMKQCEELDKFMDLGKESKNMWSMKLGKNSSEERGNYYKPNFTAVT